MEKKMNINYFKKKKKNCILNFTSLVRIVNWTSRPPSFLSQIQKKQAEAQITLHHSASALP